MHLDLSAVLRRKDSAEVFNYTLDFSKVETDDGCVFTYPVLVSGNVKNISDSIMMDICVKTQALTHCDRCNCEMQIGIEYDQSFFISPDNDNPDNDAYEYVDGHKFDIYEWAYDSVLLEYMQKHLCKADCKGLCPVCGNNLNATNCGCVVDVGLF